MAPDRLFLSDLMFWLYRCSKLVEHKPTDKEWSHLIKISNAMHDAVTAQLSTHVESSGLTGTHQSANQEVLDLVAELQDAAKRGDSAAVVDIVQRARVRIAEAVH